VCCWTKRTLAARRWRQTASRNQRAAMPTQT